MTNAFYNKAFQDTQLDPFIRDRSDPHGERFASWIAEKMGLGTFWSDERQTRTTCPFQSKGHTFETPHDRSSHAAWHSQKGAMKSGGGISTGRLSSLDASSFGPLKLEC